MLDPDEHDYPDDRCLDDAWATYDDLDERYGETRWPNPRILLQDREWVTAEGQSLPLSAFNADDARTLMTFLRREAVPLHVQASVDEHYTLSSAMSWAFCELAVPLIKDVHPQCWLDAQPLMRTLARLTRNAGDAV